MLLSSLFLVAALHAQPTPVLLQAQTTPEQAEGAEILRRILVDSLEKAFRRDERDAQLSTSSDLRTDGIVSLLVSRQRTVEHSRVFHLPEAGLYFSLDANLPLVEAQPKDEPAGDAPRDDEWEKYRREVQRGDDSMPGVGGFFPGAGEPHSFEVDPAAVETLIDGVLQTLARHGSRMGLAPGETITVAVRLGGNHGGGLWSTSLFEAPAELHGETPESSLGAPAKVGTQQRYAYSLALSTDVPRQNLVLQVRVGDLAAGANGAPAELRRRARINRY